MPDRPGLEPGILSPSPRGAIVSELTGSLPCVRCRYDLKGLSILSACPECGTMVRATLLAVVDPLAKELRPISSPRVASAGLVAWGTFGFLALLTAWVRLALNITGYAFEADYSLGVLIVTFTALSGLGSIALIRPQPDLPFLWRFGAAVGVVAYIPLCLALLDLLNGLRPSGWQPEPTPAYTVLAGGIEVSLLIITLGLRPNARLLAARSVLMRSGRVDRQTLLALSAVLGVCMAGTFIIAAAANNPSADLWTLVGRLLLLVGSVLFTLGAAGVMIDCWRIRPVVAQPPLSLDSLTLPPAATAEPH